MKTRKSPQRTPDRTAQDALRKRVRALENTIEHMDQGVSIADTELRLVGANRRFRELLDLPEALCRPGTLVEAMFRYNAARGDYGPGDIEEQVRTRMELARKFEAHRFERERPDGTVLEIRGLPIPGGGFVSLYTDVTQRVRSERALRESESRKGAILEASLDAVLTMDRQGRIVEFNPAAERCFGYTRGQAIGAVMAELIVPPELRERHREGLRRYLATGEAKILGKRLELPALRADGSRFDAELTISLIPGSAPPAFTGTIRDITERAAAAKALRASEERFRGLTGLSSDWYWEQDAELRLSYLSEGAEQRLGVSPARVLGRRRWEFDNVLPVSGSWDEHRRQLEAREPFREFEYVRRLEDGSRRYASLSGEPLFGEAGEFRGYRGIGRDVTQRVRTERELRESEARFRSLTELSSDWYWEQDAEFRFTQLSGLGAAALSGGGDPSVYLGKARWETPDLEPMVGDWSQHRMQLERHESFRDLLLRRRMNDGTSRYMSVSGEPVLDRDSRFKGYRGVATNVSARVEAELQLRASEARLEQLAHYDTLTGLPNRALIHDRLRQAMARAERGRTLLAVMFLDLDRFKEINDSLGHAAGDEVLKEAARRLQSCLRSTDSVGRLGGDEFTVLIEDVHHVDEITVVAGKILEAFAEPAEVAGHELRLSTSIGVTVYPVDDQDADTLLKNADMAMYQAKQEGRNNFQLFAAEMGARTERRADLRLRLHHALERGEFALHYQPQVDLAGGGIFGAEALLRWNDAELGPVSPAQFIPVAEETGLIGPIGDWVLREACRQCKAWLDAGLGPLRVAVNLSPRQFRQKKLAQRIGEILGETGLPAACLEVEITEGIVMKHAERAIKTLAELNRLGVQIAIDDFGTGYSSLAYLQRFPVHVLKIDQSFVQAIRGGADEAAIVNTVIHLAKLLGLQALAEGVETAEQRAYLHAHGCDAFQGYLFCRPQSAEAIGVLLAAHRRERASAAQ